jgi:glycosyltransferase involved in cell wall biosynthesis
MKICIVSPRAYPLLVNMDNLSQGGAEAQFKTIGFRLAEEGWDVHFVVDDYGQAQKEKADNITIHKVGLPYMGGSKCDLPGAWMKLWKVLEELAAEIYMIKTPRHLLLPIGLYCRKVGARLVFIGQIDSDVDPEFVRHSEGLFGYILFRAGMKLVDHAVAQNSIQAKGFTYVYRRKASTIGNLLTLPVGDGYTKKDFILWVGNSLPKKQPHLFPELAKRLPQYRFRMIMSVARQSPDDTAIREAAASLPNLEYLGFVPFGEIAEHFQNAKLFVSTSLREGFPNTFLQSWQYATPVVSLQVDPDELIQRHGFGRLSSTLEQMCVDVGELMEDEFKRATAGRLAKEYVEANHSVEAIVGQYIALLSSLAKKNKP